MKVKIMAALLTLLILNGCKVESAQIIIDTPYNSFLVVQPDISYVHSLYAGESEYYALDIEPGYTYSILLEPNYGDSDLYVYSNSDLSYNSLIGYSENYDQVPDTFTFIAGTYDTVYIDVTAVTDSEYYLTVSRSLSSF